jgi:hypothetical protein
MREVVGDPVHVGQLIALPDSFNSCSSVWAPVVPIYNIGEWRRGHPAYELQGQTQVTLGPDPRLMSVGEAAVVTEPGARVRVWAAYAPGDVCFADLNSYTLVRVKILPRKLKGDSDVETICSQDG